MEFTVDDYYPPEWSALPTYKYYFQIVKEGNLLGKIEVKEKQFSLIGRLQDLCDIYIDNPLVSRKHAILQAKKDDPFLYLMDLGSQHGTFVNRVQLPAKTYKKIEPFDFIKFGVSSRVFILRCPQYEKMKESEQNQRENQFAKMLEEQHKNISKEEMKAKYLDMLENDPYFAANQGPRQLQGRQQQQEEEDQYAGIDWGITDEKVVYAYKNDNEFPIEPDLLRRLNLDSAELTKLAEYEDHLRIYQQIEGQLNELTSKQKREYGLEQKLRGKKQKFQKKFMQALQALEKCQDWLRTHIFGQVSDRNKKKQTVRERQNDTFGDDVFLDRTLEKHEAEPTKKEEMPEAETYWILEAKLKSQTLEHSALKERLSTILRGQEKLPQIQIQQNPQQQIPQEDDEFDIFMKQNQIQTDNSNIGVLQRQINLLQASINQISTKLANIVGEQQVKKMVLGVSSEGKKTLQELFLQKSMEQTTAASKKKMNESRKTQQILDKLEQYQKNQEDIDEEKEQIFNYYKEYANDKEEYEELNEQQMLEKFRAAKRQHYDPNIFSKPTNKLRIVNDRNPVKVETEPSRECTFEEEQAVDLTKQLS